MPHTQTEPVISPALPLVPSLAAVVLPDQLPASGAQPGASNGTQAVPTDRPSLSVIVPCRNEERYIARCLDSILANDYPAARFEVLVVDGRSEDGTRQQVVEYATRHPSIRLLDNPKRVTPAALNTALREATGEIIVRMDAHAIYPRTYISQLVAALQESGADSVGGLIVTLPANETPTARAIAIGMSHPLGVGNSHFRIGTSERRYVDHIPFFCCRREVFERIGFFDEELIRNQDGEFSSRLIRHGGRILLLPDVVAYYYARDSLRKLARMFYQYGYFKALTARKAGRILGARQLAPAALIVSLAGTIAMSAWVAAAGAVGGAIASVYAALVLGCSARAARTCGIACALRLMLVFPLQHFTYGFGYLRRVLELATRPGHRRPDAALILLSR